MSEVSISRLYLLRAMYAFIAVPERDALRAWTKAACRLVATGLCSECNEGGEYLNANDQTAVIEGRRAK